VPLCVCVYTCRPSLNEQQAANAGAAGLSAAAVAGAEHTYLSVHMLL